MANAPAPVFAIPAEEDGMPGAFRRCLSCHSSTRGGANGIGPNLWGVVGRRAASGPGYNYSDSLRAEAERGLIWNRETLDR